MVSSPSSSSTYSLTGKRVGVIVSRYHEKYTQQLLDGVYTVLEAHQLKRTDIPVAWAPGAFELPLVAKSLLVSEDELDAIICLGVIIKGETPHFDFIAAEVARGISQLGQMTSVPVLFGVITALTEKQVEERCGGAHGHKGKEAAEAAVAMIETLEKLKKTKSSGRNVGFNT